MKCFRKTLSFLAAAALCTSLPVLPVIQADAASATTFYVKYDVDMNEWRMQIGNDGWDDENEGRELYYLNNGDSPVKNGDIVVIYSNEEDETGGEEITINAQLSNLTINRAHAVVHAGGVDECFVFGESYAAINSDVSNAYVYDDASCTFNGNVTNLNLIASTDNVVETCVTVKGTVSYAATKNPGGILNEYYNFKANTFDYDGSDGLSTDANDYSKTGSGPAATTTVQSSAAAASNQTTAAANTAANNSGYDDVPKTGENNLAAWLFAMSALCLAGCLISRKKTVTE